MIMARILIVDDSEISRQFTSLALKGHEIFQAKNGREGVARFQVNYSTPKPIEILIIDYNMPEMNGLEAIKKITEYEDINGKMRVPKIMLTSQSDLRDKMIETKMIDYFLTKPYRSQQIRDLVEECVKKVTETTQDKQQPSQ